MLAIIRDLYKRFLLAGRVYPQGLDHVREKAKAGKAVNFNSTRDDSFPENPSTALSITPLPIQITHAFFNTSAFLLNRDLVDEVSIKKAIALGRYQVRELVAISQLHKYRAMRKRYE